MTVYLSVDLFVNCCVGRFLNTESFLISLEFSRLLQLYTVDNRNTISHHMQFLGRLAFIVVPLLISGKHVCSTFDRWSIYSSRRCNFQCCRLNCGVDRGHRTPVTFEMAEAAQNRQISIVWGWFVYCRPSHKREGGIGMTVVV